MAADEAAAAKAAAVRVLGFDGSSNRHPRERGFTLTERVFRCGMLCASLVFIYFLFVHRMLRQQQQQQQRRRLLRPSLRLRRVRRCVAHEFRLLDSCVAVCVTVCVWGHVDFVAGSSVRRRRPTRCTQHKSFIIRLQDATAAAAAAAEEAAVTKAAEVRGRVANGVCVHTDNMPPLLTFHILLWLIFICGSLQEAAAKKAADAASASAAVCLCAHCVRCRMSCRRSRAVGDTTCTLRWCSCVRRKLQPELRRGDPMRRCD